jgi:hypothetical protein
VVSLSLAVTIADIPLEFKYLHMVCVGASCGQQLTAGIVQELHHLNLSVDFFATYLVVLKFGFVFVWVAVALLIFWRRSDDRMALLVALFLVLFPAALVTMKPLCPVVKSLISMRNPCAVSCMVVTTVSPEFISRSLAGFARKVSLVASSGLTGPCGTPFFVMMAKLTYSMPAAAAHATLLF